MPPLREGEGVDARREQREHPLERAPRVGDPVQEDDGHAVSIALLHVLHTHAGRQRDELLHTFLTLEELRITNR